MFLPGDLIMKIENQLSYSVKDVERQALDMIFRAPGFRGNYLYTDLQACLKPMGLVDYKTPKGSKNTAHLDYEMLDLRSIRLINRMIHFLGSHQVPFTKFMEDIVTE